MLVKLDLDPNPASVPAARRLICQIIREWGGSPDCEQVAALLASELVTNAVVHAATPFVVGLCQVPDGVRVEVTDFSALSPQLRHFGLQATTGRGLRLVATLASNCGAMCADPSAGPGKTVWFELPLALSTDSAQFATIFAETLSMDWLASTEAL